MMLTFGGVRGTSSVAERAFLRHGGDTTSFLFTAAGAALMVDAGSGVRTLEPLIRRRTPDRSLLLLLTHYHLDHIVGFPWFPLVYDPAWRLAIAAPRIGGFTAQSVVARFLRQPFWPLQIRMLKARLDFHTLRPGGRLTHGPFAVRWCAVHHPGGCYAYRVEEIRNGRAAVIATDIEWPKSTPVQRRGLLALCASPRPADVLVMDGHYTRAEYPDRRGWGHSAWEDAVDFARAAGVGRMLITHHAPTRDDAALAAVASSVRRRWRNAALARQGLEVEL